MRGPSERPVTTPRSLGKAHLYLDENLTVAHVDDMAGRLEALGFAEVFETGDKFVSKIPSRYTDYLAGRGLLDTYQKHIADRSYQGDNEDGQNATKCVPMWDSTPMPLPLDAYVDTWHGQEAVKWIEGYDRQEPFFLFVGFPGPHDPWDAPEEAVQRYRDVDISMPRSTRRPTVEGTGRYSALLNSFLWVSDSETMTDDAIRGMRRAYAADISVIDHAVGDLIDGARAPGPPGQHVDHLHERPRGDGGQPRADVQVRPLRARGAGPADRAAARGLPGRGWSTGSWSTSTCRPPCARSPAAPVSPAVRGGPFSSRPRAGRRRPTR